MTGAVTDLSAVAHELYGLTPAEFTPARNARAKELRAAGEKELADAVRAMPRPSAAAWLANAMVRHLGEEVTGLLELGEELRRAQADLDAAQLRELTAQRRRLVSALARRGRDLAGELGHKVGPGVVEQLAATLNAAMTDKEAAEALRTGLLVAPMESSGLGGVDLDAVLAVPGAAGGRAPEGVAPLAPKRAARDAERARAREAAARRLTEAQDQLAAAEAEAATADRRRRKTEEHVRSLQAGVLQARAETEDLRRRLEAAEVALERVEDELADAEDDREVAVADDAGARSDVEAARAALAALRLEQGR